MKDYFSALVKFYSTYSEAIPAPDGFETPVAPLDPSKWQHFPVECPITLSVGLESNNNCVIEVSWNARTLDMARINLLHSARVIQFTARSPTISCKYMVWKNSVPCVQRFQVTLSSGDDFRNLHSVLTAIHLVVKPARPAMSQPSPSSQIQPSQSQQALPGRTNDLAYRLQNAPHGTSAATNNSVATLTGNPILDRKYLSQSTHLEPGYLLNSQIAPDNFLQSLPAQAQFPVRVNDVMKRNETRHPNITPVLPCPKSKAQHARSPLSDSSLGRVMAIQQERLPLQPTASTIAPNQHLSEGVEVTLEDVQLAECRERPLQTNSVDQFVAHLGLKGYAMPQAHTMAGSEVELAQEPELAKSHKTSSLITSIAPEERNVPKEINCDKLIQNNVLVKTNNISLEKDINLEKTVESSIDIHKQGDTGKKKTKCDLTDIRSAAVSSSKIRVSRRLIKEKLKDESFMKWVMKVEETLQGMTAESKHNL